MKIGERKQQGRGQKQKTPCPLCGIEYLETSYAFKNRKLKRIGLYCPNEKCTYSKKD
jgi:hypothetical protein